jgi:hypothetical protein
VARRLHDPETPLFEIRDWPDVDRHVTFPTAAAGRPSSSAFQP